MSLLVCVGKTPCSMPEVQVAPRWHPVHGEDWFKRHLIDNRACLAHAWVRTDLGTFIWTRTLRVSVEDGELVFRLERFVALQTFRVLGIVLIDEWSWMLADKDFPTQPTLQVGDAVMLNYTLRVQ